MSAAKVPEEWEEMRRVAESWSPQQTLQWAFKTYGSEIAIASAFGPEGIVVLNLSASVSRDFRVFMVDTGYLFPETLELARKVEIRYGIHVERVEASVTTEAQTNLYGPQLWARDPDQCCQLRKVEPLSKKLGELRAWVTAIRRDQTPARKSAGRVQWDTIFNLVKVNPLVDWTEKMIWSYIHEHRLDYNALHDRKYSSIGCVHCTRSVQEEENSRAGRWSGFTKLECGLHGTS
jgi:phosphoadenosine phosphosulfate reductase